MINIIVVSIILIVAGIFYIYVGITCIKGRPEFFIDPKSLKFMKNPQAYCKIMGKFYIAMGIIVIITRIMYFTDIASNEVSIYLMFIGLMICGIFMYICKRNKKFR